MQAQIEMWQNLPLLGRILSPHFKPLQKKGFWQTESVVTSTVHLKGKAGLRS